jgi:hypothetical protein
MRGYHASFQRAKDCLHIPPASHPLRARKSVTCLHGSATSMSIEGGCARTVAAGLLCRRPARRLAARWRCRAGRQAAAGAGRAAPRPKRAQRVRRLPTPLAHSSLRSGRLPARKMMTAPEQANTCLTHQKLMDPFAITLLQKQNNSSVTLKCRLFQYCLLYAMCLC